MKTSKVEQITAFDVDPVIPAPIERQSPDRRRTAAQADRISAGWHPLCNLLPGLRLHPDAPRDRTSPGPRCRDCRLRSQVNGYWKCGQYSSGSAASDLRLWWPACTLFQAVAE